MVILLYGGIWTPNAQRRDKESHEIICQGNKRVLKRRNEMTKNEKECLVSGECKYFKEEICWYEGEVIGTECVQTPDIYKKEE